MQINNPVPPTQDVTIIGQPIDTNATVQNFPASQNVVVTGQPIDTNATVQNFPATQDVSVTNIPNVIARGYDQIGAAADDINLASNLTDTLANAWTHVMTASCGAGYDGTYWQRLRTPNVFKAGGGSILTTTTVIWTPASGKKFRLMGFEIGITPDLSYTTATAINGFLLDGTTQLPFLITMYAPSSVTPSMGQQRFGPINLGNGCLSSAANNALGIQFSVASVGGVFFMNAWGTEE